MRAARSWAFIANYVSGTKAKISLISVRFEARHPVQLFVRMLCAATGFPSSIRQLWKWKLVGKQLPGPDGISRHFKLNYN